MNVTELARILRITPQELKDALPLMGFDIGQKAIKVDNSTAQRIIKEWPNFRRRMQINRNTLRLVDKGQEEVQKTKEISIPRQITVKDFASISGLMVNIVLAKLMKNGIFVSLNEKIDFDTAWLIGSELGVEVKLADSEEEGSGTSEVDKLKDILNKEKQADMIKRPPIVVVMGHVDHGKTKLLDTIRTANVVDKEAGGITQHIGAYQVERKKQLISFIDTPGHEAFTAMRSRGAKVADIAILVVAADDGVKQQTIEAYRIIEKAKLPVIVAINKIDKPDANIEKTKQELASQLNLTAEDWGGKTIMVPLSARTGKGIDDLLDMILLIYDVESENIKANPKADAVGTVIESHIDKGAGPVSTMLIQNGTLKIGDQLCFNGVYYGKVRALYDHRGQDIKEVPPSAPAKILGLKFAPAVGDILEVGEDGEKVKLKRFKREDEGQAALTQAAAESDAKKINVIIKSDVLGSAEAIAESLAKIANEKIRVEIIHKGLGNITDGDIKRAEATKSIILAFNVKFQPKIEEMAREKKITVKMHNIIYHLINDVKEEMIKQVVPEVRRVDLGRLKVVSIFRTEPKSQIIGGKVLDGVAEAGALIEVVRDKEIIETGKMTKLKIGKEDVRLVDTDQECGIQYEGKPVIAEGDILQFYKEEKILIKL